MRMNNSFPVSIILSNFHSAEMLQNGPNTPINLDNKSSICSQLPSTNKKKTMQQIEVKQEMNYQKVNWRCNFRKLSEQNGELLINRGHRAFLFEAICNAQTFCNTWR